MWREFDYAGPHQPPVFFSHLVFPPSPPASGMAMHGAEKALPLPHFPSKEREGTLENDGRPLQQTKQTEIAGQGVLSGIGVFLPLLHPSSPPTFSFLPPP
jgi:hypothetical protein